MKRPLRLKIFEYASYVLLIAATAVYFIAKTPGLPYVLVILVLAMFMRLMMERTRFKMSEEENAELRLDLRRLTQLLAEEKKKNSSQPNP